MTASGAFVTGPETVNLEATAKVAAFGVKLPTVQGTPDIDDLTAFELVSGLTSCTRAKLFAPHLSRQLVVPFSHTHRTHCILVNMSETSHGL